MANLNGGLGSPSSCSRAPAAGMVSACSVVRELDIVSNRLRSEEAAIAAVDRRTFETEEQLARARAELEAWQLFDSPDGRRMAAEVRSFRERVAATRAECAASRQRFVKYTEDMPRVERATAMLRDDKRILHGSREALMFEVTDLRERLEGLSRIRLHTKSELAKLQEEHQAVAGRILAEAEEARSQVSRSFEELEATRSRHEASQLAGADENRENVERHQRLDGLRTAHESLNAHCRSQAQAYRHQQNKLRKQCAADGAGGDDLGKQLRVAMDELRLLRGTYTQRIRELQEAAAPVASERSRASEAAQQLQGITGEMTTHAEELAHQLEAERAYGDQLWKQVTAASEAARQTRDQVLGSRHRARGRENADPAPNVARVRSLSSGSRSGRPGQARVAPRKRVGR